MPNFEIGNVNEQIQHLKQQLSASLQARKSLEQTYQSQFQLLSQLVAKLSVACKGLDAELDHRLGKLRAVLLKNPDLDNISPIIEEVHEALRQYETRHIVQMRKFQTSIAHVGRNLQSQKGLPPDLRRELRRTLQTAENDTNSLHDLVPVLERLVTFYNTLISQRVSQNADGSDADTETIQENIQAATKELLNLVSELAFEGDAGQRLDNIRANIVQCQSEYHLLSVCLQIIRLIVDTIGNERQSAAKFLFSLNEALASVHESLRQSLVRAKKVSQDLDVLTDKISHRIEELASATESASSIDELKMLIQTRLMEIAGDIKARDQLESQERQALAQTMSAMQTRVTQLEKETEGYRHKLTEQKFKSLQDALTKLPNRAAFDERMQIEYMRWKRYKHDLVLAVVDIDHFKNINDTYGHSAGDKTLQVIATALKNSVREVDFIARFGGEEFVLLMPDTDLKAAEPVLEKLRKVVKKIPFRFKEISVTITTSVGATRMLQEDTVQQAFDRADAALYKAKNAGRDRVVID